MADKIKAAIKKIDDEVRRTQVNKGTEYHLGQLRAKHARLTRQLQEITEAETKKQAQGKIGGKVVQAKAPVKASDLLMMMETFTEGPVFSFNQAMSSKDPAMRLEQLDRIAKFETVQEEAAVYLLKFDVDGQVSALAKSKAQELYTMGADERREHIVQTICPFVLDYADSLLSSRYKAEKAENYVRVVKAIQPFASVGVFRERINTFFQSVLKRDDLSALHNDAALGIQLLSQ